MAHLNTNFGVHRAVITEFDRDGKVKSRRTVRISQKIWIKARSILYKNLERIEKERKKHPVLTIRMPPVYIEVPQNPFR